MVAEEVGRAVAPVPFPGGVLATAALLALVDSDADDDHDGAQGPAQLLAQVADGGTTAALVVGLATPPGAPWPDTVRADAGRLTGTVTTVADASTADVLLVPAVDDDGPVLVHVAAGEARLEAVGGLDRTRVLTHVTLDGTAGPVLARGARAAQAREAALLTGAAVLACEQVGLASRALETAVAYTSERRQFGRPVGSFQALKHRMADVWVALTQARAVARWAVDAVAAEDPDAPVAVAVAQAHCGAAAVRAAEECVQLHGGTGFTWENPSHLLLKRAKADALALGGAHTHRARLAHLVDLPVA